MWSVAAGRDYPAKELDSAWKTLLTNQFHDILPGSSIDWVYKDAERDLDSVAGVGDRMTSNALEKLVGSGDDLVVFNVNSHARREIVDLGDRFRVVEAPPCGWATQDSAFVIREQDSGGLGRSDGERPPTGALGRAGPAHVDLGQGSRPRGALGRESRQSFAAFRGQPGALGRLGH